MAVLSSHERNNLPDHTFALPEKRKYPIPDKSHAANAKARARQELHFGRLSRGDYRRVVAKADAMLKD